MKQVNNYKGLSDSVPVWEPWIQLYAMCSMLLDMKKQRVNNA